MSPAPSTSPDSGEVLNGRYEVGDLVARGGMARVHEGRDTRLERTVALKIMHPHLAEDPQFVARFAREAKAVARLSHPRVVSVFDQGEDDGRVYLAMELVRGRTLRHLIDESGPLTIRRSLEVAADVLEALSHAHTAGIIHRDIKPENILLDRSGRAKVADFGLARAVGAAQSSASGMLLGTVAYISPEVVTRGHADERSDLYSLGIVLYEMLTGRQPYTGELPVHVAFQHVHETVPAPSARSARVPAQLDSLVAWCCESQPQRRPADASALLASVRELQRSLSASVLDGEPLIVDPITDTAGVPAITSSLDDLRSEAVKRTWATRGEPSPRDMEEDSATDLADDRRVAARAVRPRRARHARPGTRVRRGTARALAVLLLLALLAGGGWFGWRWYEMEGPGSARTIPVVDGTALRDAETALKGADLEARTRETYSTEVPAGHVISASPASGSSVKRGSAVTLLVSRGVQTFPVPDVTGRTPDEARAALSASHLTLVEADPQYDGSVPKGHIIRQSADAAALPAGGRVTVVVSRGPEPVKVPDVRGLSQSDAVAKLRSAGLLASVSEAFSASVAKGAVASQDLPGGSALPGSTIAITISKGPEMVTVPNTFRKAEADAVAQIKGAGLVPKVVHDKGTPAFGLVYQQDPAGGQAPKGSTVTLHVF